MEYPNSLIFSSVSFILFNILFTLVCINVVLLEKIFKRSKNLFKYYIYNIYFSICCSIFYIVFFILFLYGLRIYNIKHTINLYSFYNNVYTMIKILQTEIPLVFIIVCIIIIISFLLSFIMLFIITHKYFIHHIFIIYIYISGLDGKHHQMGEIFGWQISPNLKQDLISYIIYEISWKITVFFFPKYILPWYDVNKIELPWYYPHFIINKIINYKYYNIFISFTPFIVILYDCVFNNLIITHIFYYLIIYVPLIWLRRIVRCIWECAPYICDLLWNIYYKKEHCIYALPPLQKEILDLYLLTNLAINVDIDTEIEIEMSLKLSADFEPDNRYANVVGYNNNIYLERTVDNRLFYEHTDPDDSTKEIKDEWILLADKTLPSMIDTINLYYVMNNNIINK